MVYKIPGTKWSWEKLEIGLSYVDIWRKLFKLKKNSFMEWFENGFVKNWSIWNIFNTLCTSKKRFWTQMNLKVNWKMPRLGRNDWDRTRPQLLPTMQLKQGKESWRDLVSEIILINGPRWEGDWGKLQLCQDAVSHIFAIGISTVHARNWSSSGKPVANKTKMVETNPEKKQQSVAESIEP